MMEQIKYINHLNEELVFGNDGMYVNENDLRDFSWSVVSENNRISGFNKGITKKKLPVIIKADSNGQKLKNRLFEIAEKDVLTCNPGKIVIGDYYLKCYVIGSKKKEYLLKNEYYKNELSISTDQPEWRKEITTTFNYGVKSLGTNLDYNNDFAMDYTSNLIGESLNNNSLIPTNFVMRIYGVVSNPQITIRGHVYEVNAEIGKNEYLVIDSLEKTIKLIHTDGSEENCFKNRSKEFYVFEKIPVGINTVAANGEYKFDITILEERGEPKWT